MANELFSGPSPMVQMGNLRLRQPLPQKGLENVDPFLLIHHYGPFVSEPGQNPMDLGPHPHRGFEPITILLQGSQLHRDSLGNRSVVKAGEAQWTTAGRGIIHSEGPSKDFVENGGTLEGLQIWLNLAQKYKMIQPNYQHVTLDEVKYAQGQNTKLAIYAGDFEGLKGAIRTPNEVNVGILDLSKNAHYSWRFPKEHQALIYLIDGEASVAGKTLNKSSDRILSGFKDDLKIYSESDGTKILLMSGKAHREKVVQWGPYVMNSQTEIMEALRDFQMGKLGFLTPFDENPD